MTTIRLDPWRAAEQFAALELARAKRVAEVGYETALICAEVVAKAAPVDTGMLKNSVVAERLGPTLSRIVARAPHAGILELGSRPHMPPLAPILAWVTRHKGNFAAHRPAAAKAGGTKRSVRLGTRIKRAIKRILRRFGIGPKKAAAMRKPKPALTEVQLLEIANLVRWKIYKHGTKPTHWMRKTLPRQSRILAAVLRRALREPT